MTVEQIAYSLYAFLVTFVVSRLLSHYSTIKEIGLTQDMHPVLFRDIKKVANHNLMKYFLFWLLLITICVTLTIIVIGYFETSEQDSSVYILTASAIVAIGLSISIYSMIRSYTNDGLWKLREVKYIQQHERFIGIFVGLIIKKGHPTIIILRDGEKRDKDDGVRRSFMMRRVTHLNRPLGENEEVLVFYTEEPGMKLPIVQYLAPIGEKSEFSLKWYTDYPQP